MKNETLRAELNNLERKVKLLLSDYAQLKTDFDKCQTENQHLKAQINDQQSKISSFQNQSKISKIVESMVVGENDSEELKDVIDGYIKEINKCIAHLGEA
ncbi:DUF3450 domain-containing protein [Marinoscillum pacificum]|uniref:DUF3450 domain-containing protein n=1 Tax=Marinoscillum pacificum TaxID=392723 RepID=UPI0021570176|nr:DUF3450 domain-containing protein [Marinoscillum pacificum]